MLKSLCKADALLGLTPAELRCAAAPEPSSGAWGSPERCGISDRAPRHSGMAAVGSASVWVNGTFPSARWVAVSAGRAGGCVGLAVCDLCGASGEGAVAVSHGTEAAPLPQQGQCCSMGCC